MAISSVISRALVAPGVVVGGNLLLAPSAAAGPDPPITIEHTVQCDGATGAVAIDYAVTNISSETVQVGVAGFAPRDGNVEDSTDARTIAGGGRTIHHETVPATSTTAALNAFVTFGSDQRRVVQHLFTHACSTAHTITVSGTASCDSATGTTTIVVVRRRRLTFTS